MKTLVLGSTSIFRKSILEKLNLPFECAKPNIDESALESETPQALVERLAIEKAKAVSSLHPNALIIGSDQVAVCEDEILEFCKSYPTYDEAINKFGEKIFEYELLGMIKIENGVISI